MALYAYWAEYVYTVSFDIQSADTPLIANIDVVSPAVNLKVLPDEPVRTGYIFSGWFTEPSGKGSEYLASTIVLEDKILYAYWKSYDYVVDFNSVGATVAANPAKMHVMSPAVNVGGLPVQPEKTGYIFGGWYTGENGAGTPFSSTTEVSSSITVYPKWDSYNYSVQFDSQGGSSVTASVLQVSSPAVSLESIPSEPVKSGYSFGGWFTEPNGEGSKIDVSTIITSSQTAYAFWKDFSYTVTFDSQGAETVSNPGSKIVSSPSTTLAVMPSPPVKAGYAFGGWFTEPEGAGTEIIETTAISNDMTIYAKWLSYDYIVTFNSQDADTLASPESMNVASPETCLGSLPSEPVREGFNFIGWYTEPDGQGDVFNEASAVGKNVTVYAFWAQYVHVVSFDSRDADSGDPASINVASPSTTIGTLPEDPEKSGFIFSGWFTQPDGNGVEVNANTVVSADITLYAYWVEYGYQIRFDSQEADTVATPDLKTVVSPATTLGVLPSEPVRTGYDFGGWFTEVNGGGTQITASTTILSDMNLYANWLSYDYSITFNSQDADTAATPAIVQVASPAIKIATLPNNPVKTGYIFGGWFTDINGSGNQITEATLIVSDMTVYANWISYDYTVTFDSQSADTPAGDSSVQVASPATTLGTLPAEPVRNGYTFCGWYTAVNGGGSQYFADTPVSSDVQLYAYWRTDITIQATVHIPSPENVSITNDNAVINKGESIAFSVDSDIFWSYQWFLGSNQVGSNSGTLVIDTSALEAKTHTVMLKVTCRDGSSASAFIRFRVVN